ncbi:MAG: hypothetical protein B6D46_05835 [Polyangiaceae bacterium UTPRO1]|jgi:hypothetical protein|nr:MAG: hypothetical protein B6D46_05835 [Polyangiaceae bacterium UTPRO1]
MTIDEFIRHLENLRVDRARGPAKPYKPLLVLAVVVLFEKGEIVDGRVLLDGALKSVFDQLLRALYPQWPYRADIKLPFRHLESDGVWRLVPAPHALADFMAAQSAGAKAPQLLRSVACAEIDPEIAVALAGSREARFRVIETVAKNYLPANALQHVVALLAGRAAVEPLVAPEMPPAHALEREVEEYLERRWDRTPFAKMGIELCTYEKHGCAGRQLMTPVNAIDLLGFRDADHAWWVFELKKGRPADKVVGQVSRYKGWLEEDRGSRSEPVHGAIIAGDAGAKLRYAAKAARVDVWVYDAQMELKQVS